MFSILLKHLFLHSEIESKVPFKTELFPKPKESQEKLSLPFVRDSEDGDITSF